MHALGTIDAEVNKAGVGVLGVQETFTPDDIDALMRQSDRSRDASLQGLPEFSQQFLAHFEQALAANPAGSAARC